MKSTLKLVPVVAAIAGALLVTGCSSSKSSHELYAKNNQGFNAAGFVDWSPASYQDVSENTDAVYTDELIKRKNISGDNLSLFWGALTIADY